VAALSPRLQAVVDALPLRPGLRVIEIGCGPGAAAREVADRVGPRGHVLAVDRSAKAISQVTASAADLISAGRLTARQVAAEDLELDPGEQRYDIAFALRVGALDGRHPRAGALALIRLGRALVPGGRLFIDGGHPLREVMVHRRVDSGIVNRWVQCSCRLLGTIGSQTAEPADEGVDDGVGFGAGGVRVG